MATRNEPIFLGIDHSHPVTPESDAAFWNLLQVALLVALKERGKLSLFQYQNAISLLKGKEETQ